jgi:VIT1/CCC1 family predicted Fe2+/Mn2+ transporter
MQSTKDDRSLGELFAELSRESSTLVRQEIELAKTEMSEKVSGLGTHAGMLAAGGALAYAGLLAIIAAAIIALDAWMPLALSALLVGVLVALIGYFMLQKGLSALKQVDLKPRETIESLKEDKEWAQQQTK